MWQPLTLLTAVLAGLSDAMPQRTGRESGGRREMVAEPTGKRTKPAFVAWGVRDPESMEWSSHTIMSWLASPRSKRIGDYKAVCPDGAARPCVTFWGFCVRGLNTACTQATHRLRLGQDVDGDKGRLVEAELDRALDEKAGLVCANQTDFAVADCVDRVHRCALQGLRDVEDPRDALYKFSEIAPQVPLRCLQSVQLEFREAFERGLARACRDAVPCPQKRLYLICRAAELPVRACMRLAEGRNTTASPGLDPAAVENRLNARVDELCGSENWDCAARVLACTWRMLDEETQEPSSSNAIWAAIKKPFSIPQRCFYYGEVPATDAPSKSILSPSRPVAGSTIMAHETDPTSSRNNLAPATPSSH